MRQLNNNHFDTNLGATSQVVSSASQPLSVTTIIKDEIMKKNLVTKKHTKEISKALRILEKVRDDIVIREKQAGMKDPKGNPIRFTLDDILEDRYLVFIREGAK
jgi:hypothetical protein